MVSREELGEIGGYLHLPALTGRFISREPAKFGEGTSGDMLNTSMHRLSKVVKW